MIRRWLFAGALLAAFSGSARAVAPGQAPPTAEQFRAVTEPLFAQSCGKCHNPADADGGLDVSLYGSLDSLSSRREGWEKILGALRAGDMPPSDEPRSQPRIDALVAFLDAELARIDASARPDPGRVTLRRLNRTEYTNTIRDLLAVEFRAEESFPADDSGEGFDNIGDVLTVSPLLMEKYLVAAEGIAERALGTRPLPKPVQVEYRVDTETLERLDPSTVELRHSFGHSADYELVVGLPGERPRGSRPVTLAIWLDGEQLQQRTVKTTPNDMVVFNPYSEERITLPMPAGQHTLRLGFLKDGYTKKLSPDELYNRKVNKFIGTVTVVGPFPAKEPSPSQKRLFVCDPATGKACVERILSALARRAYRRPVTAEEVAALNGFVSRATADGRSVEQGLALALQAVLVSPHFLFHVERDRHPTDPAAVHPVTDPELASRLSYFLWSSMPDDELLALASQGRLGRPRVLRAQVRRMLADPKAAALGQNFAGQWLETRNLDLFEPDPQKFPSWRPELRQAMKRETELFFTAMLQGDRPLGEFLGARYTFLNQALAEHYGIDGVEGEAFRRVALRTDQRGGILGHASVLAVSSYPTRTSVSIRGKYVLQNLLGAPPPPPPPNVPALDEGEVDSSASLRKQMEMHRANPTCASCHARMDPLGFGLENYDAIGRWRTEDGGQPIDASGTLPGGQSFDHPAQLRRVLEGRLPEFTRCLTEKLLTYALGRRLELYDRRTVRAIAAKLASSGGGLQTLVQEIAQSLPFRSRRGEGSAAGPSEPAPSEPGQVGSL